MQTVPVIEVKKAQALNILMVLDALGADVLIERTPLGACHVAVTLPSGGTTTYAGSDLADALGQATVTLALDHDVDLPCWIGEPKAFTGDADKPIELMPQTLLYSDEPVEFCKRFVCIEEDGQEPSSVNWSSPGAAPRVGNLDKAIAALTVMAVVR